MAHAASTHTHENQNGLVQSFEDSSDDVEDEGIGPEAGAAGDCVKESIQGRWQVFKN